MLLLIADICSMGAALAAGPEIGQNMSIGNASLASNGNETTYEAVDVQNITIDLLAGSGSWIGLGGYATSNPSVLGNWNTQDSDHIFVVGGDKSLWEETNGNWIYRGGYITSNPSPIYDSNGNRHVFVRGGDGSVWDNLNGVWKCLGGYVTTDVSVVWDPANPQNALNLFARGGDNCLWMRTVNLNDLSGSWQSLGGIITSKPAVIVDSNKQKTINILVRGSDNGLWLRSLSRVDGSGSWWSLGGFITSDPCVYQESDWSTPSGGSEPSGFRMMLITARGGDNSMWLRILDTRDMSGYWQSLGGSIQSNSDAGRSASSQSTEFFYTPQGVLIGKRTTTSETMSLLVRGNDNALWRKDTRTTRIYDSRTGQKSWAIDTSSAYQSLGGIITSGPMIVKSGYVSPFRAVVRGGDGSVWMNR
jgi:hypothetical protein